MRKFTHILAFVALLLIATPALAVNQDESCKGNNNCNTDSTAIAAAGAVASGGDSFSGSQSGASATQGQSQGLVGIQGQLGILDSEVDSTNEQDQHQGQSQTGINKQGQTSVGEVAVDSHDSVNVEGDDVVYEAPDIPVNSAAPVFAGACSQGVSIQTSSFGGSVGSSNPVCDYVAVAGGFVAAGERTEALRVLGKAEKAADWRYLLSQIRSVITLGLL